MTTVVALHPRVAQLRGHSINRKKNDFKQQKNSPNKPVILNKVTKSAASVRLDEVAKWASTPREFVPQEAKEENIRPPPFRRHATSESDETDLSIQFGLAFGELERSSNSAIQRVENLHSDSTHRPNESPLPESPQGTVAPSMSIANHPVPTRSTLGPSLKKFLNEMMGSITRRSTPAKGPPRRHSHEHFHESEMEQVSRPPSRLGYNIVPTDALVTLQALANRVDTNGKVKQESRKEYRHIREALSDIIDDEEDLSEVHFSDSDEDEEQMKLNFAKIVNGIDFH